MKTIIADGNEACAHASYMFTEVAGIYPITPSSSMPQHIDKWASKGKKNLFNDTVKIVEMQSEAGAIGMVHGSLQTGLLTSTYTSSQGLLLMIPNMYKIAGETLPCVIHVAARSLSTHALSIFGDHQDIYATRATGFCMLASSNVQDAYYLGLISHLSAIKSSLPFLHFFDGFRTSHEINKINIFENAEIQNLLDHQALETFRNKALGPNNPVTRGTNQNSDIYFQITESRNKYYEKTPDIVYEYMKNINEKAKTNYKPFNYYGNKKATKLIIAMGSVCETIKETIDTIQGEIGLVEVHLYRPFSKKYLLQEIPETVKSIAVLDRTKEAGSSGEPLYLDVLNALKDKNINIVGGRYGLSGKNTTPGMIKAVFDSLDNPQNNFTIGIKDDITNLSLNYTEIKSNEKSQEFLLYGYGSDGTISTAKTLLELVGNHSNLYIQGYFEYDSKKSGGVTTSNLRFSKEKIKQTYLVDNPQLIVVTKDSYLNQFNILKNIQTKGILLINTNKNEKEINKLLSSYKEKLTKKQIKVYTINASELANQCELNNKISMIIAAAIIKISDLFNYNQSIQLLKNIIIQKFKNKNPEITKSNIEAIEKTTNYLKQITLDSQTEKPSTNYKNIYQTISHREGNNLKVSDFKNIEDGTCIHTEPNKNPISETTPKWLSENCIQCGICSLVCPHGVIRPYLIDANEYKKMPDNIKQKCIKAIGIKEHYFIISISKENCTGCGICINTCPGRKKLKALIKDKYTKEDEFNYLENNIKEKNLVSPETIKGTQLKTPKFAFHGACAGCGQTAYIKLLTQIFKDNLIIANATGCSSIYGASMPDMPYNIPWANSLFEDNAEFSYGMLIGYQTIKNRIKKYMQNNPEELFEKWLNNPNDYQTTKEVYEKIDYEKHPQLKKIKNYITARTIWAIGGDGWAYDIGFSGIDHILSSGDNINILVLDSQVYSNTGGQASKSTPKGAVAQFAATGKTNNKKDLAKIAMTYPNTYVAQVNLGANMMQVIKALEEANKHNGPSIIIAYTPCISHGIKGGMSQSINIEKMATQCGYFLTFRYNGKLTLDSKNPNFELYDEFLNQQSRYAALKKINKEKANQLLTENKNNAIERFKYYQELSNKK